MKTTVKELHLKRNPNGGKLLLDSFVLICPVWPGNFQSGDKVRLWLNDTYLKTVEVISKYDFKLRKLTDAFSYMDLGKPANEAMDLYRSDFEKDLVPGGPEETAFTVLTVMTVSEDMAKFEQAEKQEAA